jgi:starch phosphorylase
MYYKDQGRWVNIVKKAASDIVPAFEAGRMAKEYYEKMY